MMESGFWGVILKPEKRYEQTVEAAFHVTKACMDLSSSPKGAADSLTSVFVEIENDEFLICNLNSKEHLNVSLDLNFMEGEKICFRTSGGGTVHLTGYLIPEENYDETFDASEAEEASDDEEVGEEEEDEEIPPQLVNGQKGKKRKLEEVEGEKKKKKTPLDKLLEAKKKDVAKVKGRTPEEIEAAVEKAEKMKKKVKDAAQKAKKPKLEVSKADSDDSDEDDDDTSDDGIMDFTDNFAEEGDSEEDDDDDIEEEGEEDDDDDDEDDEEEEEEDEEDAEEEEEEKSPSKKVNGTKTPNKKEKNKNENKTPKNEEKTPKAKETPKNKEEKTPKNKDKNKKEDTPAKTPKSPKRVIKGNIQVEDLKIGNGPEAKKGKFVGMYYEGRLKTNNKQFDATLSGKPFKFRLGAGEVIKGWDLGLEGIKVGGKRRLIIPPGMAYGAQGAMPDIPPHATLIFDVECKYVN